MRAKKAALLSTHRNNDQLLDFAKGLAEQGLDLLSTTATNRFLMQQGIPSADIGEGDEALLKYVGDERIILVYVDLSPFPYPGNEVREGGDFNKVIHQTDIGGSTLLRAAAKNRIYVVSRPDQFDLVLENMSSQNDPNPFRQAKFTHAFLSGLAMMAEETVAAYATASATFHRDVFYGEFPRLQRTAA